MQHGNTVKLVEFRNMGKAISTVEACFKDVDCASLNSINIHFNQLQSLSQLPLMQHVTEFTASSNAIDHVDWENVKQSVPSLLKLDLSANQLFELNNSNSFFPRLRVLSLAYNSLTSLDGIENFMNLEELDLRGNRFEIDECIDCITLLTNLRKLWIFSGPRASVVASAAGYGRLPYDFPPLGAHERHEGGALGPFGDFSQAEQVVRHLFRTCLLLQQINDRGREDWEMLFAGAGDGEGEGEGVSARNRTDEVVGQDGHDAVSDSCSGSSKSALDGPPRSCELSPARSGSSGHGRCAGTPPVRMYHKHGEDGDEEVFHEDECACGDAAKGHNGDSHRGDEAPRPTASTARVVDTPLIDKLMQRRHRARQLQESSDSSCVEGRDVALAPSGRVLLKHVVRRVQDRATAEQVRRLQLQLAVQCWRGGTLQRAEMDGRGGCDGEHVEYEEDNEAQDRLLGCVQLVRAHAQRSLRRSVQRHCLAEWKAVTAAAAARRWEIEAHSLRGQVDEVQDQLKGAQDEADGLRVALEHEKSSRVAEEQRYREHVEVVLAAKNTEQQEMAASLSRQMATDSWFLLQQAEAEHGKVVEVLKAENAQLQRRLEGSEGEVEGRVRGAVEVGKEAVAALRQELYEARVAHEKELHGIMAAHSDMLQRHAEEAEEGIQQVAVRRGEENAALRVELDELRRASALELEQTKAAHETVLRHVQQSEHQNASEAKFKALQQEMLVSLEQHQGEIAELRRLLDEQRSEKEALSNANAAAASQASSIEEGLQNNLAEMRTKHHSACMREQKHLKDIRDLCTAVSELQATVKAQQAKYITDVTAVQEKQKGLNQQLKEYRDALSQREQLKEASKNDSADATAAAVREYSTIVSIKNKMLDDQAGIIAQHKGRLREAEELLQYYDTELIPHHVQQVEDLESANAELRECIIELQQQLYRNKDIEHVYEKCVEGIRGGMKDEEGDDVVVGQVVEASLRRSESGAGATCEPTGVTYVYAN